MHTSDKWQTADGTDPYVAELECGTQISLLNKDCHQSCWYELLEAVCFSASSLGSLEDYLMQTLKRAK